MTPAGKPLSPPCPSPEFLIRYYPPFTCHALSIYRSLQSSEFLTGFRKRNLARKEAAKLKAKSRDRQARLDARKEQRQSLADQARQNAQLVEQHYGSPSAIALSIYVNFLLFRQMPSTQTQMTPTTQMHRSPTQGLLS